MSNDSLAKATEEFKSETLSLAPNIDEMPQRERTILLAKLLRYSVGAVKLDGGDDWCVSFEADVPGNSTATLTGMPFMSFLPRKLVISEPVYEGDNGLLIQPRGIWKIQSIFVGQRAQLPTYGAISGDAFGPDSELTFQDECQPGLAISLIVQNTLSRPAKFNAYMLGRSERLSFNEAYGEELK